MNHDVEGPVSARALADLARAGYFIVRQPSMQVNFEVHHLANRPLYLVKSAADATVGPRETLSSGANGIGLVVTTRSGPPAEEEMRRRQRGSNMPADLKVKNSGVDRIFIGTAWPNPSFVYESAEVYEGLVSIEIEPRTPQHRHAIAIRDLMTKIADLAANDASAPILSLQCPAQLPQHREVEADVRTRSEDWPRAASIAVRFAIALQRSTAGMRLELTDSLSRYCSEHGYGLWLTDTRSGYRSGNWFGIQQHDKDLARHTMSRLTDRGPASAVSCALPITFVGPARRGSTHSILSLLSSFRDVGILACSVTALDDLAFIHVQLASVKMPASRMRTINQQLDAALRSDLNDDHISILDALRKTLAALIDDDVSFEPAAAGKVLDFAGDYQTLIGPTLAVGARSKEARRPIWFSWQADTAGISLVEPLTAFYRACSSAGLLDTEDDSAPDSAAPLIEYLICRDLGDGRIRAKGKMSVVEDSLPQGVLVPGLESREEGACGRLREAWRIELDRKLRRGSVAVYVSPYEYRLGRSAPVY